MAKPRYRSKRSYRIQLLAIFLVRTVVNTAFRIIYPFLPSIARGLDISLPAASRLVTMRLVAGMGAPFLGPLADRHGRRQIMRVALVLLTFEFGLVSLLGLATEVAPNARASLLSLNVMAFSLSRVLAAFQ